MLILVVVAVVLRAKKSVQQPVVNNNDGIIDQSNIDTAIKVGIEPTAIPQTAEVKPPTAAQQEDIVVKNLAKVFVERYHTYSSENNYENIRDVQALVTPSFWSKISVPLNSPPPAPNSFVSLTTKVVSIISVDVDKSTASVEIKVKKVSVADNKTSTGYGEYTVMLAKVGSSWLVSGETSK